MIKVDLADNKALKDYYGRIPVTMKAWIVKDNDKVLGIFGIEYHKGFRVAFSEAKEIRPKLIISMAWFLAKEISQCKTPVFAIRDKSISTADRFLKHIGFTPFNDEVYVWHKPQQ